MLYQPLNLKQQRRPIRFSTTTVARKKSRTAKIFYGSKQSLCRDTHNLYCSYNSLIVSLFHEQVLTVKMVAFPQSQRPIETPTDDQESTIQNSPPDLPTVEERESPPTTSPTTLVYEVVIPQGVKPNDHFTVMASNYRVVLKCPPIIQAGRKVRFKIPVKSGRPAAGGAGGGAARNRH